MEVEAGLFTNRLWLPFELPATVPSPLTGFGTVVMFVDRLRS